MRVFPSNNGRALALAILVGAVAVAASIAGALHSTYRENRHLIGERQGTLQSLRAIAAQIDEVRAWTEELKNATRQDAFLTGENQSLVLASLQSRVAAVAEQSGAALTSFRTLEPRTMDGFLDMAVEVDLRGDLASVRTILQSLEGSEPVLFIARADLRASQRATESGTEETILDVQLEVHGYMRADPAQIPAT